VTAQHLFVTILRTNSGGFAAPRRRHEFCAKLLRSRAEMARGAA